MVSVCLQCGGEGWENAYVHCVKCLNFAVHRYCLPEVPKTFDEFVWWYCDDCEAVILQSTRQKSIAKPQRDTCSELIKLDSTLKSNNEKITKLSTVVVVEKDHDQDVPGLHSAGEKRDISGNAKLPGNSRPSNVKLKVNDDYCHMVNVPKKQGHESGTSVRVHGVEQVKVVADSAPQRTKLKKKSDFGVSISGEEQQRHSNASEKFHPSSQNKIDDDGPSRNELKKKDHSCSVAEQRCNSHSSRPSLEARAPLHSAVNVREAEPVKRYLSDIHTRSEVSERVSRYPMAGQPATAASYVPAQPLADPIWSGSFKIINNNGYTYEGFVAHLSNRGCRLVYDEARLLPSLIRLEMLPKAKVWPKSFEKSKPTDDNIALYIFPADRRYERVFDHLVKKMLERELAMKAITRNAELLIFSSTELPVLYWRFQRKYYLWGVFRGKK